MLLQLENTNEENISKLIDYANQLHLHLSVVDLHSEKTFLPGKPLTNLQLKQLIESSRKSGVIKMEDAHQLIRKSFNAD